MNTATLNEDLIRQIDAEKQHYNGIEILEKEIQDSKIREEKAKQREELTKCEMAKMMLEYGALIKKIMELTGFSEEKIISL